MHTNNEEIRLDYEYYNNQTPILENWIKEFIGEENIKFIDKEKILPERPQRDNKVDVVYQVKIYDKFDVSFGAGADGFSFRIKFSDLPKGYKLKTKMKPSLSAGLIIEDWDYYEKLSFSSKKKDVLKMLKYLVDYLEYLMVEKEKHPDLAYCEISEIRICSERGWDYQKRFNSDFEKIED